MRVPFKMKQERGYPQGKLFGGRFFGYFFIGKSDSPKKAKSNLKTKYKSRSENKIYRKASFLDI